MDKTLSIRLNLVLWAVNICIAVFLCIYKASILEAVTVLFSFGLFCLPGVFILKAYTDFKLPELIIFGSVVGMGISCLFVTLFVFAFGWSLFWVIFIIVAASLIFGWMGMRRKRVLGSNVPPFPEWSRYQYFILAVSLLIMLIAVFLPLLNIGKLTDQGYGFTWLIGQDFLWRVSVTFSVARGLPAEAFDFGGESMKYYVLFYTLPAFAYKLLNGNASMVSIMILLQVFLSMYFVSTLFACLRALYNNPFSLTFTMLAGVAAYSYNWLFYVAKQIVLILQIYNLSLFDKIMALKWMPTILESSGHSHTFYRFIMVQPHVLIGLSFFLLSICLVLAQTDKQLLKKYFFCGLLIGIIWGVELSMGLISALIIFNYFFICFFLRKGRRAVYFKRAFVFGIGLCLLLIVLTPLGMYSKQNRPEGTVKIFNKNPDRALKNIVTAPVYIPVEYGPAALFSFLGLILLWRNKRFTMNSFPLIMLFTCLLLFCLPSRITGPVKLMRFLPIAFIFVSAYLIDNFSDGFSRERIKIVFMVLLLSALPSYFLDIYIGSNVGNYHNTAYVLQSDMQAVNWVKQNTKPDSVIQGLPHYYTENTNRMLGYNHQYSLFPCFADRKMSLGRIAFAKRLFPGRKADIKKRSMKIQQLFLTDNIENAAGVCRDLGIDYVYIGQREKNKYPDTLQKFKKANHFFSLVYDENETQIYMLN